MKFLVAVFVIAYIAASQALTDDQKEKLTAYHKECLASSGVDQELVTKARKGEFVDDAKLKEHLFCVSKKVGFQNEAGDVDVDVLKAKLAAELKNDAEAAKLVAACAVKKESPQQTAYDTVKCYAETTHNKVALA